MPSDCAIPAFSWKRRRIPSIASTLAGRNWSRSNADLQERSLRRRTSRVTDSRTSDTVLLGSRIHRAVKTGRLEILPANNNGQTRQEYFGHRPRRHQCETAGHRPKRANQVSLGSEDDAEENGQASSSSHSGLEI